MNAKKGPSFRTTAPTTDKDKIKYLLSIKGSTGLFIHFGLFTALRISEILSLRWIDVMIDGRPREMTRVFISKQGKWREITFADPLKGRIIQRRQEVKAKDTDYIFVSESNHTKGNLPITKEAMNARIKPHLVGAVVLNDGPFFVALISLFGIFFPCRYPGE